MTFERKDPIKLRESQPREKASGIFTDKALKKWALSLDDGVEHSSLRDQKSKCSKAAA